jgi:hypothetical protein
MLDQASLAALAAFPERLRQCLDAVPPNLLHWAPPSWNEVPSERLTALEQVCHLRDIEIDGYQRRFRRLLDEAGPFLESIDGYALARQRGYGGDDANTALAAFRAARQETLQLLRGLEPAQWQRRGEFEGYGPVTLRGMAHYLCSHDQQHLAGMQWLLGKMQAG